MIFRVGTENLPFEIMQSECPLAIITSRLVQNSTLGQIVGQRIKF